MSPTTPPDPTLIPRGLYCYTWIEVPSASNGYVGKTAPCPYWHLLPGKPEQANGYCAFLGRGDWDEVRYGEDGQQEIVTGTTLLWDGCKECEVNEDIDEST